MKATTIIFDFDGTLADTLPLSVAILNSLAKTFKFEQATPHNFEQLRNMSSRDILKYLKIPAYVIPLLLWKGKRVFAKHVYAIKLCSGMPYVLAQLKQRGIVLGVLTSNRKDIVEQVLKNNNDKVFDFIYSKRQLFGKHRALKRIIKKRNLVHDRVIYVGDETRDIIAAHKVGVVSVGVTWGIHTRSILQTYKPQHIIDSPQELLNIIDKS